MRERAGAERIARLRGGPKHDLWVVPYADMLTLLFALFVLLYAMGEVRVQKLEQLRRSLSSAFSISAGGYTDDGEFDLGPSPTGGELIDGFELVTMQLGAMQEFLADELPPEFEKEEGKSLEIVLTDDTVAFEAPLSALYDADERMPRESVRSWLIRVFERSWDYTSKARIRIEAPDVVIGRASDGRAIRSDALCEDRLVALRGLLRLIPQVEDGQVTTEFRPLPPVLSSEDWQASAKIVFAFSNQ